MITTEEIDTLELAAVLILGPHVDATQECIRQDLANQCATSKSPVGGSDRVPWFACARLPRALGIVAMHL